LHQTLSSFVGAIESSFATLADLLKESFAEISIRDGYLKFKAILS